MECIFLRAIDPYFLNINQQYILKIPMLIQFHLKQTKPIEFCKQLETYIMQHYQESQLYEKVKPSIEATQKIRNSLDFDKINISIANDAKTQEDLEQNLITYLKYLAIYKKRLRFEHNDGQSVKISFMWGCSYNPSSMAQSSSIQYEMAAIYYNLALTEYYLGSAKLLRETDVDRKQAISRLRNGAWAIQQCKQIVPLLPQDIVSQHIDFSQSNLDALENCLIGLSYKALYENIAKSEKEFGIQNVATVLFEGSKYFQMASASAKAMQQQYGKKIKEQTITSFITAINYYYAWTVTLSCQKLAQCHYQRIQDESRGQNMGKALGFIAKAESTIMPIVNDKNSSKVFTSFQLDALKGLASQLQALKTDYTNRNTQIYKEQICQEALLPFPPIVENLKIKPLVPAAFNEPLPDESNFEGFVSEEAILLTKEIKSFVEQRKYELDEAFKMLNDQKNKAYAENYVNVFLDMANAQNAQQTQQLSTSLKQKIDNIRSRGGLTSAQKQLENCKQQSVLCEQQIGQIRQKILVEKQEDDVLRNQYAALWKRQPSDSLNKEFNTALNDLQNKLRQAQTVDMEVQGLFQQSVPFIQLTEQPDSVIAASMPQSNDNTEFLKNNQPLVGQLAQQDNAVTTTQEEMKQIIFKFYEVINQTNYTQQAIQAIQQGTPKSQVMNEAVVPVSKLIEQFNEKMNQASAQVSAVCGLAAQLSQIKRQSRIVDSSSQNFSAGFTQAQEVFDNMDFGFGFYTQMKSHLEEIDRKVMDFLMARQLEKDQLIKSLQKPHAPAPGPQNPAPGQQQHGYPQQYPQQFPQQFPTQVPNQFPQQQYPQQYPPQYYGSQQFAQPPGYQGQSQWQGQQGFGQPQGQQQGYAYQQPPPQQQYQGNNQQQWQQPPKK